MNMDKLSRINKIEKEMLELEEKKQSLFELGLEDEDRYKEFMELDDKIDELMQEHSKL